MKKRHLVAILLGIVTVVLAGNLLNHLLGWDLTAILAGLVAGLEVGYWIGAPEITRKVHLRVLSGICSKTAATALLSLAGVIVFFTAYLAAIGASAYIGIHVAEWVAAWSIWGGGLSSVEPNSPFQLPVFSFAAIILSFAVSAIVIPLWLIDALFHDNEFADGLIKFLLIPIIGIGVGLVMPFVIIIGLPVLALAVAGAVILLAIWGLTSLVILAGKEELITITVGITIGGLSGLVYGQWTHLEVMPTMTAIAIGAITGLPAAYAVHRLGRAHFLLRLMGKTEEAGA